MVLRTPQSQLDQLPTATRPERTGDNPVERLAVAIVRREIAAMPASLVVQLALWPDDIAHWARDERLSESLVYNMLAARKPYSKTRARLADRLAVPTATLDHLVEARRPQPSSRLGPDAVGSDDTRDSEEVPFGPPAEWPPIDWRTPPWPRYREGTNPIERRAVRCVEVDLASMPAATVVGLAIWPETLAEWSRRERLKSSVVWATLSGSPSAPVRDALARRLGVTLRDLDSLVSLARRVPIARRPSAVDRRADLPRHHDAEPLPLDPPRDAADTAPSTPPAADTSQLTLGL
jgi:hypothetical protein